MADRRNLRNTGISSFFLKSCKPCFIYKHDPFLFGTHPVPTHPMHSRRSHNKDKCRATYNRGSRHNRDRHNKDRHNKDKHNSGFPTQIVCTTHEPRLHLPALLLPALLLPALLLPALLLPALLLLALLTQTGRKASLSTTLNVVDFNAQWGEVVVDRVTLDFLIFLRLFPGVFFLLHRK